MLTLDNQVPNHSVSYEKTLGVVLDGFSTIIEQLYDPKSRKSTFVICQNGSLEIKDQYEDLLTGTIYQPITDDAIKRNILLLPSHAEYRIIPPEVMIAEVKQFICKYVDIDPAFAELAARFVVFTWVNDPFDKTPYFRLLGPYGTGKTRFLDILTPICRHSLRIGTGMTSAALYRLLDKYPGGCVLIIDEANFEDTDRDNPLVQILNGGYSRNGVVWRCDKKNYEPRCYSSFAPKIFAANHPFKDDGIESRIISDIAYQTCRQDIPTCLPAYDQWDEVIELRNKLLSFRLSYLPFVANNPKPVMPEHFDPRFREVLLPLFQISGDTSISQQVINFLDRIYTERLIATQFSDEAILVKTMINLKARGINNAYVGMIAECCHEDYGLDLTPRKIGATLRSLGVPLKQRDAKGIAVCLNAPVIDTLARRYHLDQSN